MTQPDVVLVGSHLRIMLKYGPIWENDVNYDDVIPMRHEVIQGRGRNIDEAIAREFCHWKNLRDTEANNNIMTVSIQNPSVEHRSIISVPSVKHVVPASKLHKFFQEMPEDKPISFSFWSFHGALTTSQPVFEQVRVHTTSLHTIRDLVLRMGIFPQCQVCARGDVKLLKCKRCLDRGMGRYFCSKECQTTDWATHKDICRR